MPVPARLAQRALVGARPRGGGHPSAHARSALEGELLRSYGRHPVREALARLEAGCTEAERAALPGNAQRWLAQGVARGMWTGLAPGD